MSPKIIENNLIDYVYKFQIKNALQIVICKAFNYLEFFKSPFRLLSP
ncbi:hypothetical protein OENI_340002 [Oenococcus oeni]|nr:hypothetical protein OENI_340002 [Oenococcus oeni]